MLSDCLHCARGDDGKPDANRQSDAGAAFQDVFGGCGYLVFVSVEHRIVAAVAGDLGALERLDHRRREHLVHRLVRHVRDSHTGALSALRLLQLRLSVQLLVHKRAHAHEDLLQHGQHVRSNSADRHRRQRLSQRHESVAVRHQAAGGHRSGHELGRSRLHCRSVQAQLHVLLSSHQRQRHECLQRLSHRRELDNTGQRHTRQELVSNHLR